MQGLRFSLIVTRVPRSRAGWSGREVNVSEGSKCVWSLPGVNRLVMKEVCVLQSILAAAPAGGRRLVGRQFEGLVASSGRRGGLADLNSGEDTT